MRGNIFIRLTTKKIDILPKTSYNKNSSNQKGEFYSYDRNRTSELDTQWRKYPRRV